MLAVSNAPFGGLRASVNTVPHGTALHKDDGMVPVLASDGRRQAEEILSVVECFETVGGPGLVDKDEAIRVQIELAIEPVLALLQDIGAVLLGSAASLFLRVMPRRMTKW
ncbi:hypothetical protein ACOSOMT5_P0039 [Acidiphilium sp. MT5]